MIVCIEFQIGTVNSSMPRVSYMKAIDCHLFVSFGFVFATMLEYVILLNVKDRKKRTRTQHEDCEVNDYKDVSNLKDLNFFQQARIPRTSHIK